MSTLYLGQKVWVGFSIDVPLTILQLREAPLEFCGFHTTLVFEHSGIYPCWMHILDKTLSCRYIYIYISIYIYIYIYSICRQSPFRSYYPSSVQLRVLSRICIQPSWSLQLTFQKNLYRLYIYIVCY